MKVIEAVGERIIEYLLKICEIEQKKNMKYLSNFFGINLRNFFMIICI